jgi:hypothetical protein
MLKIKNKGRVVLVVTVSAYGLFLTGFGFYLQTGTDSDKDFYRGLSYVYMGLVMLGFAHSSWQSGTIKDLKERLSKYEPVD